MNEQISQLEEVGSILWDGTKDEIESIGLLHSGFLGYCYSDVGKGYFTVRFYGDISRGYGIDPLQNCVMFFGNEYEF